MYHDDPAEWQEASETPDMAQELDTMEDVIAQAADEHLQRARCSLDARKLILPIIVSSATEGISRAKELGLLHDEESATYTPKFREALARILAEIWAADNPRLHIDALDYALQLGIRRGVSQTEIAREHGVNKACISKICVGFTERYGLPPGRGMKPEAARAVFAKRQTGKRARPPAEPWELADVFKSQLGEGRS